MFVPTGVILTSLFLNLSKKSIEGLRTIKIEKIFWHDFKETISYL